MTADPRRVLIVEDEVILALDFSDAVTELGYEVVGPALSLEEALKLAECEQLDCALLDVNLGRGLTSRPVAEALRGKQVRIAFVTAYNRDYVDFARADETILNKPPSQVTLSQLLESLCP